MAINKNSTGYTVLFTIVLVSVCGLILASLATALKPLQKANVENEKRQFILSAAGYATMDELKEKSQEEISKIFSESVVGTVYNFDGSVKEGAEAFDIDIVKEYKMTKNTPETRQYPLFTFKNGSTTKYIVPSAGNGLWGPVWMFAAIGSDKNTIEGIVFDHKSETPGLGAKITDKFFIDQFISPDSPKRIMKGDKYTSISIVKGGVKDAEHQVDAIAGATITSNGVSAMLKKAFKPYMKAWNKIK